MYLREITKCEEKSYLSIGDVKSLTEEESNSLKYDWAYLHCPLPP